MDNVEYFVKLGRKPNTKEMRNLSGAEVREINKRLEEIMLGEIVKKQEEIYEKTGLLVCFY